MTGGFTTVNYRMHRAVRNFLAAAAVLLAAGCGDGAGSKRVSANVSVPEAEVTRAQLVEAAGRIQKHVIAGRMEEFEKSGSFRHFPWNWGPGVLMFGMAYSFRLTGDRAVIAFLNTWTEAHRQGGIPLNHTDRLTPFGALAELAMITGDTARNMDLMRRAHVYLTAAGETRLKGCETADGGQKEAVLQWRGRAWLDDMFMTAPFMLRYSRLVNDSSMERRTALHFLAHRDFLQCRETLRGKQDPSRLLRHGAYLFKDYWPLFWFPTGNAAWGRGNGWYIAALADFLAQASDTLDLRDTLMALGRSIIDEVIPLQSASGLLHTVLDDPESCLETSATALFTFAAASGIHHGWLEGEKYRTFAERGLSGILGQVESNGRVSGVSGPTPVLPAGFFYKQVPVGSYPWGEGSVLMALTEAALILE